MYCATANRQNMADQNRKCVSIYLFIGEVVKVGNWHTPPAGSEFTNRYQISRQAS